jgi:conjugal transfer pilus assembly protein TraE
VNLEEYKKSWNDLKSESKLSLTIGVLLAAIIFILVFMNANRDTIVTIIPYSISEEVQLGKNSASKHLQEQWGWMTALALGTVTEENVEIVKRNLAPLLAPNIRKAKLQLIEDDLAAFSKNNVEATFHPEQIHSNEVTGEVWVTGTLEKVILGEEQPDELFYYYIVVGVDNYRPIFTELLSDYGKPEWQE